jgi:ATP-dependent Clp protease ATP-binding subunit ClpA
MAAQEEARAAGNDEIGAGHLALGLLHEPEGLGGKALAAQRLTPDAVRAAVSAALPGAAAEVPDLIPYDAGARKVLELTFREAIRLSHNYVGTEHILLALLEFEHGEGALSGLGLTKAAVEGTLQA